MDVKSILRKVLIVVIALLASCEKEEMHELCFIGDSNVERWDLQRYFPSFITRNYGKGGSGIDYVSGFSETLKDKSVVVLTGTNDIDKIGDEYMGKYIQTIENLNANKVLVVSILPRISADIKNERILELNDAIGALVKGKGWHYIDMTDRLMEGQDILWEYYSDGLHLSEHGYELLAREIIKNI